MAHHILSLLSIVVSQIISQCIVPVPVRRMHHGPGRLIQGDEVFILIQKLQNAFRRLLRNHVRTVLRRLRLPLRQRDPERLPRTNPVLHGDRHPVRRDSAAREFRAGNLVSCHMHAVSENEIDHASGGDGKVLLPERIHEYFVHKKSANSFPKGIFTLMVSCFAIIPAPSENIKHRRRRRTGRHRTKTAKPGTQAPEPWPSAAGRALSRGRGFQKLWPPPENPPPPPPPDEPPLPEEPPPPPEKPPPPESCGT